MPMAKRLSQNFPVALEASLLGHTVIFSWSSQHSLTIKEAKFQTPLMTVTVCPGIPLGRYSTVLIKMIWI